MARLSRASVLLLLALTACSAEPATAQQDTRAAAEAKATVGQAVMPGVVAARELVQEVVPPRAVAPADISPAAVKHIIRWEITSPSYYQKRLRWPIWPGGASGVTWCVGYDGGHQTRAVIARDWSGHPKVDRLATTSGLTGQAAKVALPQWRDIETAYPECEDVFRDVTLPAYEQLAKRTFRNGWDRLSKDAKGSLTGTVYNRGAGMNGDRRKEMRVLKDECVPAGDVWCMGRQYRSMCRIWRGTDIGAGLCARYEEAARLAEGKL